jgi:KaiC/GvpD/RAD55 family RecA-like ATPase
MFYRDKGDLYAEHAELGWDFEKLEQQGRVAILDLSVTREAGIQKNLNTVMETMTSLNATRLVIDSFTAINMGLKDTMDIRVITHLLYRFLKKANCVSVLVIDQPWGSSSIGEGISEFITDGIIHLETYFDKNEVLRRRLRTLKMRGTSHTRFHYPYEITSRGFTLSSPREHEPNEHAMGLAFQETKESALLFSR